MQRLDGKRIVLTGAAGGLGAPLARKFHAAGAQVTGVDRVDSPDCAASIVTDLSDDAALATLAGRLADDPPDILINLAGVMRFGLLETQPIEALALCYRVNLLVPAALAGAVAGPMRARGHGQIVNVGSAMGAIPYPWFAAYSSSKAGLSALSQALRRELGGSGVTVTHISPRAAKTPFNAGDVDRFLALTGMKADPPDYVTARIFAAIAGRHDSTTIGAMERVYGALNALAPAIIDGGLKGQVRRVRAALS